MALGHSHRGQTQKQNVSFLGGEGQFIVEISATLKINAMPTGSQSDWGIWGIGSLHKSAEETSGCGEQRTQRGYARLVTYVN